MGLVFGWDAHIGGKRHAGVGMAFAILGALRDAFMEQEKLEHPEGLDLEAAAFYGGVITALRTAGMPFLVGGGFAFSTYTGIVRDTKDLDLFILPSDVTQVLELLARAGYRAENKFPHWLAKVYHGSRLVDVIFSSGNGICAVDHDWFENGTEATVVGHVVQLMGVEEMIWQKAYIMERHRFDGADIIHLIHARRDNLDWEWLATRFGEHWPLLLCHLLFYRFVYPDDHSVAAVEMTRSLLHRMHKEVDKQPFLNNDRTPLCRGTLLSLLEYLPDIEQWGYRDARLLPDGTMSSAEVEHWTNTFER